MNIIGITGRAGSGKSTVARILTEQHGFVEVALADPLKRICRDVFGFTDAQLWGPSSERNKSDERWPRHHAHAGDTLEFCDQTQKWVPCECCGWRFGEQIRLCYLTPRFALQQLGTEWGRGMHPDVWVRRAIETAKFLLSGETVDMGLEPELIPAYSPQKGLSFDASGARCVVGSAEGTVSHENVRTRDVARGVVISDVRFPNEAAAIRAEGGRIWRTTYGDKQRIAGAHENEQYVDEIAWDLKLPPDLPPDGLSQVVRDLHLL